MFYAHSNDKGKEDWQLLHDHLIQTGDRAAGFMPNSVLADLARIAGMLHDLGKYSKEFQARLEGASKRVEHSVAGAQWLTSTFVSDPFASLFANLLGHCIVGHHAGLPDSGSVIDLNSESTYYGRLKRNVPQIFPENGFSFPNNLPIKFPIKPIPLVGVPAQSSMALSASFLTRMIYSGLVDADFLDTEEFMKAGISPRGAFDGIEVLRAKLEARLAKFGDPKNELDRWRSDILAECRFRAMDPKGFFALSVPTGGGKTLSSMAFALDHAVKHGMDRVIYVIPYTSIIEQNARVFKDIFGADNVLEHHSNFDLTEALSDSVGESSPGKLKYAAENWDVPIIVTTNVQFFESIYASRGSRCRKNHNIMNSVIVLDEAQMLPTGFLRPILLSLDELVTNYGSSVVVSTATQPELAAIHPRIGLAKEMVDKSSSDRYRSRRNTIEFIGECSPEELEKRVSEVGQTLCVVNTRKFARKIFDLMPKGSIYLSTYLCPKHRSKIISKIREDLSEGRTCRVISTQLVEAGVDLDFEVGFRALAGLDSIIQAAGRVNREGKRPNGPLYVFDVDPESKKRTPESIRQRAEIARLIFDRFPENPSSEEAIRAYYKELYHAASPDAFDLIGVLKQFNVEIGTGSQPEIRPDFRFRTVADGFELIDSPTSPLIIPWEKEAIDLIDKLRVDKYPRRFARKLQPYVVSVYNHELARLAARGAIIKEGEVFNVLSDQNFYNEVTGLEVPDDSGGNALFF